MRAIFNLISICTFVANKLWTSLKTCYIISIQVFGCYATHRVPTPTPLPLRVAKTGKNQLNEELTPLLPTGIGERFNQTISNLGHEAFLRQCELPL